MKALIIAAGGGERLRPYTLKSPKPLIKILEKRLIEWIILSARKSGILDFVVVVGYLGDKIREFLKDGERFRVRIKYIENSEWEKSNGISVLKGRKLIKGNFVLLMSDHLFDSRILDDLLDYGIGKKECVLCVDENLKDIFDTKNTTKVLVSENKVLRIGKSLKIFNAIDTGIFLCSPHIFEVLDENIKRGLPSLTDSIRTLAKQKKMLAKDIKGRFWMDIDTPKDLSYTELLLKKWGGLNKSLGLSM
ncbi:MAG: sugar phosphate nucleotidyltransferase [Candidatus Methanofastidiosia archaeon]